MLNQITNVNLKSEELSELPKNAVFKYKENGQDVELDLSKLFKFFTLTR